MGGDGQGCLQFQIAVKTAFIDRVAFELKLEGGEGIGPSVSGGEESLAVEMVGAMTSEPGSWGARMEQDSEDDNVEEIQEEQVVLCRPLLPR